MWSNEAENWPTASEHYDEQSSEDAKQYLSIEERKLHGFCGGSYKSQFIKILHPSLKIAATIKTVWHYQGQSGSSTKQVSVFPGD